MADVTKSLTIQSTVEGGAESVNTLNKIGDAAAKAGAKGKGLGDGIDAGARKGRSSFLNLERAAAAQAARLDIVTRAQQRYNKEVEAAGRFKNAGAIDESEYQKRIELAEKQRKAMLPPGHGDGGETAGLSFMQKMESMHVLKSLADESIATGQPLRALALEGGRIAEIYGQSGSFGKAMSDVKTTLGNMIGPLTATKLIIAGLAGGALLAVAGFFAFKASIDEAIEKMDALVKIGAGAAKAGVGTSFFQSWTHQAKELNLETTDLVAMLEKARQASTERISDADTKEAGNKVSSSEGRSRIQQNVMAGNLNKSDLAAFKGADTQEAKIRVVLNLIDELRRKGAELAALDLGKTFFGDNFETQMRNGVDMVGKMRESLDSLKSTGGEHIISAADIQKAQQLKEKFDELNNQISDVENKIRQDLGVDIDGLTSKTLTLKEAWLDVLSAVSGVLNYVRFVGQGLDSDVQKLQSLGNADIWKQIYNAFKSMGLTDPSVRAIEPHGNEEYGPNQPDEAPPLTVKKDTSHALPSLTPDKPKKPKKEADQVETYIKSLQKQNAAELAEVATLGMSNKAKQEAIDLAKAEEAATERKKPLSAGESAKVKALADAYVDAKDKIEAYNKAQENAKETASFFGNELESALQKATERGARLEDIFMSLAKSIEQAALKALLLGEGPLASLFGTAPAQSATGTGAIGGLFGMAVNGAQSSGLFGGLGSLFSGFHADGGTIPAGHWGVAGEAGAEIINGPATVTPMKHINAALNAGANGRGGMSINHSPVYNIDARGAQVGVADQISSAIQSHQAYIERNLPHMINKSAKRYG